MTKFVAFGFALAIAGGLQAAVADDAQLDPLQKQGRSSVVHQAAAPAATTEVKRLSYIDALYQRKLGRLTPMEEARQNEERASAAFRAEPAAPAVPYIDQFMRAKLGRSN